MNFQKFDQCRLPPVAAVLPRGRSRAPIKRFTIAFSFDVNDADLNDMLNVAFMLTSERFVHVTLADRLRVVDGQITASVLAAIQNERIKLLDLRLTSFFLPYC